MQELLGRLRRKLGADTLLTEIVDELYERGDLGPILEAVAIKKGLLNDQIPGDVPVSSGRSESGGGAEPQSG